MSITDAAYQKCINPDCGARFDCGFAVGGFKCPKCGELLDTQYNWDKIRGAPQTKQFRQTLGK